MPDRVYPLLFPAINWTGIQEYFRDLSKSNECPTRQLDKWGFSLSDPLACIPALASITHKNVMKKHLVFSFLFIIPQNILKQFQNIDPDFRITELDTNDYGIVLAVITANFYTWERTIHIDTVSAPILEYLREVRKIFESTSYKQWRHNDSKIPQIR